jgi:tyrosyl-tRNA synthetase
MDVIRRGADEVILEEDLRRKLGRGSRCASRRVSTRQAPDLHLGHTVVLNKMRQFQDLGHHVMFLIGDFTG